MALIAMLTAGAGMYLLICAVVYLLQDRLLFLPGVPGRAVTATPAAIDLRFEELAIATADGVRLHGWWVPAEGARLTLAHFHGNAGNIGHRLEHLQLLHALGVNVLLFDYRGYGQSEGTPREEGLYRDAEAVWEHLTGARGLAPQSIVIHGQSMGGAVAAWLAARRPAAGLILESAFTSVPDMAGQIYWWLPGRYLTWLRLDTRGELARVRCPVLVIHSRGDEIIPFGQGETLFAAASDPKTFVALGGAHNDGFWVSREAYTKGLKEFLDSIGPLGPSHKP